MAEHPEFKVNPKMQYRRLGPSGLRVSCLALGGWLTLGGTVKGATVNDIVKCAFDNGINFIDVAESYAKGESERAVGQAIKELNLRRSDLVISTKVYFGVRSGPNDTGLSRKHIIEGINDSLERLQLSYVDVYFAHRPDPTVPMEEVVRAFNHVINTGKALYWGTSEWSAREIEEAFHVADRLGLVGPIAEQPQHNLLKRDRVELEYLPIFEKYGIKTTVFGALAGGFLTGKYNDATVPQGSRYDLHTNFDFIRKAVDELNAPEGQARIATVRALSELAEKDLGLDPKTGVIHLSLAYILKMKQTGTVILGCKSVEQLNQQLGALDVLDKIDDSIVEKVEKILGNKPVVARDGVRLPL